MLKSIFLDPEFPSKNTLQDQLSIQSLISAQGMMEKQEEEKSLEIQIIKFIFCLEIYASKSL